jgi:hypothetical protein
MTLTIKCSKFLDFDFEFLRRIHPKIPLISAFFGRRLAYRIFSSCLLAHFYFIAEQSEPVWETPNRYPAIFEYGFGGKEGGLRNYKPSSQELKDKIDFCVCTRSHKPPAFLVRMATGQPSYHQVGVYPALYLQDEGMSSFSF